MNPASPNKKITVISLGILLVLALAVFLCWASLRPQALEPVKEITLVVTHSDSYLETLAAEQYDTNAAAPAEDDPEEAEDDPEEAEDNTTATLTIRTTARTLVDAFQERNELLFVAREDGIVLGSADGEIADFYHNQSWICYQNSAILEEPLDEHRIQDGDTYYFYLVTEN